MNALSGWLTAESSGFGLGSCSSLGGVAVLGKDAGASSTQWILKKNVKRNGKKNEKEMLSISC